jgi:hypothetical protein
MPSLTPAAAASSRVRRAIGEVLTREEVLVLLSAAARTGTARVVLEELRRGGEDVPDVPSVIDELARQRTRAAAEVRP